MKDDFLSVVSPPISLDIVPMLSLVFITLGSIISIFLFQYEFVTPKHTKSLVVEILIALSASNFLGTGLFFMFMTLGVYL